MQTFVHYPLYYVIMSKPPVISACGRRKRVARIARNAIKEIDGLVRKQLSVASTPHRMSCLNQAVYLRRERLRNPSEVHRLS